MYNDSITKEYVQHQLDFLIPQFGKELKITDIFINPPDPNRDFISEGVSCAFDVFVKYVYDGNLGSTKLSYPYEINSSFIFARPNGSLAPKVAISIADEKRPIVNYKSGMFFTYEYIYYSRTKDNFKYNHNYYTRQEFMTVSQGIELHKETKNRIEMIAQRDLTGVSTFDIFMYAINASDEELNELNLMDLNIMDPSSGLTNFLWRERFKVQRKMINYNQRYGRVSFNPIQSWIYKFFSVTTSAQLQTPSISNPVSIESNSKKLYIRNYGERGVNFVPLKYNYSLYGVICPIKTIESNKVNIKNELASNIEFINGVPTLRVLNKEFKQVNIDLKTYVRSKVVCSESWNYEDNLPIDKITYSQYGRLKVADKDLDWDYIQIENGEFSVASSCIPLLNSTDSSRGSLGSHMMDQAIPVIGSEPPVVYTKSNAYNLEVKSKYNGVITKVGRNGVTIQDKEGNTVIQEMPKFRKSSFHTQCKYDCMLSVGDEVKEGDSLFNLDGFDNGVHTGINVVVGYMHTGGDYEDGIVMRSGILPKFGHRMSKTFTNEFNNWEFIDETNDTFTRGIPAIGTKFNFGDVILKGISKIDIKSDLVDALQLDTVKEIVVKYPINFEGTVTGVRIYTNVTDVPSSISEFVYPNPGSDLTKVEIDVDYVNIPKHGDKFTTMYGCKGTVCKIIPDEEMFCTMDGTMIDVIISPTTTIGRKGLSALKVGFLTNVAKKLWSDNDLALKSNKANFNKMKDDVSFLVGIKGIKSMSDEEFVKYHNQFKKLKSYRIKTKVIDTHYTYKVLNEISERFKMDLECKQIVRNDKFVVKNPIVVNTLYLNRLHFVAEDKQSATPFQLRSVDRILGAKHRPTGQKLGEQELHAMMASGTDPSKVLRLEREQLGQDLVMQLLLLGQGLEQTED